MSIVTIIRDTIKVDRQYQMLCKLMSSVAQCVTLYYLLKIPAVKTTFYLGIYICNITIHHPYELTNIVCTLKTVKVIDV
jgi:hypothetical protein